MRVDKKQIHLLFGWSCHVHFWLGLIPTKFRFPFLAGAMRMHTTEKWCLLCMYNVIYLFRGRCTSRASWRASGSGRSRTSATGYHGTKSKLCPIKSWSGNKLHIYIQADKINSLASRANWRPGAKDLCFHQFRCLDNGWCLINTYSIDKRNIHSQCRQSSCDRSKPLENQPDPGWADSENCERTVPEEMRTVKYSSTFAFWCSKTIQIPPYH